MMAALSGATWRFIDVPANVLSSTLEDQRKWVTGRVRGHYEESDGKCLLFGDITGYIWRPDAEESIYLNVEGDVIGHEATSFQPVMGSISHRNKQVTMSRGGEVSIDLRGEHHDP